jgi:hypothetical protein
LALKTGCDTTVGHTGPSATDNRIGALDDWDCLVIIDEIRWSVTTEVGKEVEKAVVTKTFVPAVNRSCRNLKHFGLLKVEIQI